MKRGENEILTEKKGEENFGGGKFHEELNPWKKCEKFSRSF